MTKFYAATIIAMLLLTGCNSSNNQRQEPETVQPVAPVAPVYPDPEPVEPPTVSIPTAGIGSIKSDMDCSGGTITTNYTFGNVEDDSKSFIIQYQRNGVLEDLTYPSTSTTGSRTLVKDIYYARPNDDDRLASWIVTISYQGADETYNLVTATLGQPKCDDNVTAVTTTYEVK